MTITADLIMKVLGWCTVINLGFLFWWFFAFVLMRDTMYALHNRWFNLTPAQFDSIHYCGMATLKILVLIFNLGPYLALRIVI
ncbi:MAG: DUF6868 family protein [Gammaproteobacteria bacterium]